MWERALRMLGTKQLDLTPILGGTFPVEDWKTAFEKMHSGEFIKSVIKPA
jgi:alcohol dehydrogenase/L-iditol 2-dehydrogenase